MKIRPLSLVLAIVSCGSLAACNGGTSTDASTDGTMDIASDANADVVSDTPDDTLPPDAGPLPDLTIDSNELQSNWQITMQYFEPNACEIGEMCVDAPGWRRLLMFTTFTPNLGDADLNLGHSDPANPNFEYSTCHMHYHFRGYAQYLLLGSDGSMVAQGHKQSFCVEDLERVLTTDPTVRRNPQFGACGTGATGLQGISRGWADDYYPNLPCQWIDITDVPPGQYTLHVDLNYEHRIQESDYTNNSAEASVVIPASYAGINPLAACPNSGPYQGVGRNCGWQNAGVHTCTPGDMMSVGCNADCGVGSCTGSWDIRICEGGTPCAGGDAMHLLQQDTGSCGTGVFNLDETCGVARFACPPSGMYTVLSAPDFDGDSSSSCNMQIVEQGADGGMAGDAATDGSSPDSGSDAGPDDASMDAGG